LSPKKKAKQKSLFGSGKSKSPSKGAPKKAAKKKAKKKAARKKAGKSPAKKAAKKVAKKAGKKEEPKMRPVKVTGKKKGKLDRRETKTVECIVDTADGVHTKIMKGQKPELKSPVRALSNVRYDARKGYFQIGRGMKVRALTVNTVRTFAQTLRLMGLSKEMVDTGTFATKREAYYVSKNWEEARFNEQTESDAVMDDIEAMFSVHGVSREELKFYPEEHGGAVAGHLKIIDKNKATGQTATIDCTQMGTGAYTIPHSVEHLAFDTKARFILAIETGGMFARLQSHGFWDKANCIIVSMGGVPTRATRRFIRRLSDEKKIPVYAFVDCDPYGISNIYRTLKVGSGNAAHISRFFCVPKTRFLGVTPQDIEDYELPTHPLKDVDIKRAKDALKNDPFFSTHKEWKKALEKLIKMGVRAEQQALAKWGLNYVIEKYLPKKLKTTSKFLP
jgi:DNA topoisomerase-6 subunit A